MKQFTFPVLYILLLALAVCGCNEGLDITGDYAFDLITMPYPKKIIRGETVEIRCRIVKEGNSSEAKYFIRYFQTDGKGELRLDDDRVLLPNDLFLLTHEVFRLYYTSHCAEQQNLDVYVEDGLGRVVRKTFSFQNENAGEKNKLLNNCIP